MVVSFQNSEFQKKRLTKSVKLFKSRNVVGEKTGASASSKNWPSLVKPIETRPTQFYSWSNAIKVNTKCRKSSLINSPCFENKIYQTEKLLYDVKVASKFFCETIERKKVPEDKKKTFVELKMSAGITRCWLLSSTQNWIRRNPVPFLMVVVLVNFGYTKAVAECLCTICIGKHFKITKKYLPRNW